MVAKRACWPDIWLDVDFDSSVDPYAWAKRTKRLDDWFSESDYLQLYDIDANALVHTLLNHVEMYYLGKVGCRFQSYLFSLVLYHNKQIVVDECTNCYQRYRGQFVDACFVATGCLRRFIHVRDVRRLILQQCKEQDWIFGPTLLLV
jgi:hypothetical protein